MHFILLEFIKQRTNDKRLAYLIIGIIESCRQYNLQSQNLTDDYITYYKENEMVIPGKEEKVVTEILNRLKAENNKLKSNEDAINMKDISSIAYSEIKLKNLVNELNESLDKSVIILNKYIFELTQRFQNFNDENKNIFLNSIINNKQKMNINDVVIENLKKSINNLPEKTKKWIQQELQKLESIRENYPNKIINEFNEKNPASKFNFFRPYIMLYLLKKIDILK